MPAYADSILPATAPDGSGSGASQANQSRKTLLSPHVGEIDVVISGMSGRFPESSTVEEFSRNLYEGNDMITEDGRRWLPGIHGLPKRSGKIVDLKCFDAPFFSVSPRQAHYMDPQIRLLLEVTHEALFDAGIHPDEIRGKKVGVYVGVSVSESENFFSSDPELISGYGLTGTCRAMFANRISFALDLKGPSFAIDTACSSSLVAFTNAWMAIKSGQIDAAIVAGSNLTLKPESSMQFNALNMLSVDGCCKSFDASGNGYVRSEAVSAIYLQRSADARRTYAQIIQSRMNTDGFKSKGITFPSGDVQKTLLQEVYQHSGISPSSVSYVEAHGTGTKAGDPQEVNAIADVFCQDRGDPLLIGSVKSNMGHAEAASGLCSVIKVLIAMQKKEIPANLHFRSPNTDIPSLLDGRIKVVNENMAWKGGYAAVNSFGFGGANVHLVLKSPDEAIHSFDPEIPVISTKKNSLPRLVLASGRTEDAIEYLLTEVKRTNNAHLPFLLDKISTTSVNLHPYRGFSMLNDGDNTTKVLSCPPNRAPLWLIFTGMGSQWTGCGRELMKIPVFANAIQRCRVALMPYNVDVVDIITRMDPDPMTTSTNSFTAIAAVQVGLVEVLRSIGLTEFDGVLGHSVGELGCAFVDGTLTAEQTVLTAYWRGRAVEEAELPSGAMAAVGLSGEEAQKYCGNGPVVVACYNASDSVTISGPKKEVEAIKGKLVSEEIFCKAVNSGGIAFHHSSLKKAAPKLLSELKKFIQTPHRRSNRWVSTSVPEARWASDQAAAAASPEYFVNNLVSPVLFAQGLAKIPEGATVVEVSPHALLQAVLRRAIKGAHLIPLVRKDAKEPLSHFLKGLGSIYASGNNINLNSLYSNEIRFPVPPDTPGISSFIRWDHDSEWDVPRFTGSPPTSEFKIEVDLRSPEFSHIEGHMIDGRVLFPATGYLVLVWRALAKLLGSLQWEETSITFHDVTLHQATVFTSSNPIVSFTVRILLSNGKFEILSGEMLSVSGVVHAEAKETPERKALKNMLWKSTKNHKTVEDISLQLDKEEVYKELKLRGYEYSGFFRGIQKASIDGSKSEIAWQSNWIAFLDTMLQASLVGVTSRGLSLPTRMRKVVIEPAVFKNSLDDLIDEGSLQIVKVCTNRNLNITACPGVEIYGLKASLAPRKAIPDDPLLESYTFYPRFINNNSQVSNSLNATEALKIIVDIIENNNSSLKIKIAQILPEENGTNLDLETALTFPLDVAQIIENYPQLSLSYSLIGKNIPNDSRAKLQECGITILGSFDESLLIKQNLIIWSGVGKPVKVITESINNKAFILTRDASSRDHFKNSGLIEVASIAKYHLYLLKKPIICKTPHIINIGGEGFTWLNQLKKEILGEEDDPIWLVSQGDPLSGLMGMFNCLRREPGGQRLRCIFDLNTDSCISEAEMNSIIEADLAVNVLSEGSIGTMRHQALSPLEARPSKLAYLNVLTRGDLASLTWLTAAAQEGQPGKKTVMSTVYYAPLNFRDIMLASGKLPPDALPGGLANKDCVLGLEFSGISEDRSRVMGLVPAGGLATCIQSDPLLTWKVPSNWSLKEASTVPVVYATAYYALVIRGGLRRGESILIHAGSGGVGQAAISIALSRNCRVFTTISSEKKKGFLKEKFPQLTEDSFANSRDASFEYDILERTQGEGVDLVLNSLAGELLQASVRCLKEHGRFLEIGKADLANNTALGMSVFLKNITFHGILLDALFTGMKDDRKRLQELLYEGMIIGEVTPLPATCYPWHEAEDAFRFMASGKHIGKVVLEIAGQNGRILDVPTPIPSVYRFWPNSNLVYIITGGLGGLGLELCEWLIVRGAKKVVLTSRRGISTGYQALCMRRWESAGVIVRVLKQDASTLDGAEKLIIAASEEGSVGGIFHLAMILEDSILENQSVESFQRVCQVKANGAIALDQVSRMLCPYLHVWVTFSSVACGRGNPGQSNYGWANSVSEQVVRSRVRDGLPGLAIQWGGIGDVGVLATTLGNIDVGGTRPQSVRSVMQCLDHLIGSGEPVVSSICLASRKSGSNEMGSKSILAAVANVLGIRDVSKSPTGVSLGDLGLDSLMGVEIKQILEREADVVLSAEGVRDLTLNRIMEIEKCIRGESDQVITSNDAPRKSDNKFCWIEYPLVPKETLCPLNEGQESSVPPLFMLSPMQGTCEVLRELSQHILRKVIGIQYPSEAPSDNTSHLAAYIVQKIETAQPEGPICLAGYSYGACIATEISKQLEKKGRNVRSLILLDGSHSYVTSVIRLLYSNKLDLSRKENESLAEKKERETQEEAEGLVMYCMQLCSLNPIALRKELVKKETLAEKASHAASVVISTVGQTNADSRKISKEEIIEAARLFFLRMKAAFEHDVSSLKIRTRTLFFRAGENTHADLLSHDYGLSEVIESQLQVEVIPGTHESIIQGTNAELIAQHMNKFMS